MAIVCLLLLATGACRTDPAVTLLERENRQLEDVIYQQQDIIEDYRRALESFRTEETVGRSEVSVLEGPSLGPSFSAPPPRGRSTPSPRQAPPEEVPPPVIELPEPSSSGFPDTLRSDGAREREETPGFMRKRDEGSSGGRTSGVSLRGGNTRVAQLTLPKIVAWEHGMGRSTKDEGISIVVQPRDAAGRLVEAAAPLSVVVLDPARSGPAARVARWEFSAEQINGLMRNSSLGGGLHLEMTWPAAPPTNSRLHLFVRYMTDDGRKVEANRPFDVDAPAVRGPNLEPTRPDVPASEPNRTATEPRRRETVPSARAPSDGSLRTAATPTLAPPKESRPEWSPGRP